MSSHYNEIIKIRQDANTEYSDHLNNSIDTLYASYGNIQNAIEQKASETERTHELMKTDYTTLDAKLDTSFQSRTYFLFILWSAIFFILLITLFINVVGDISQINTASKIVLLCICLYMSQMIFTNVVYYLQNNAENKKNSPEFYEWLKEQEEKKLKESYI
tara:strand:+ start:396 stop:878 length:483 start_codon:yes stop_codon:yes gene_type:complete